MDEIKKGQNIKYLKIIGNVIIGLILVVGIVFAFSILPFKANYKIYAVMSGSMEPSIKVGSVVFSIPRNDYAKDDVITFFSRSDKRETVTHRIAEVTEDNGVRSYVTKGDANNAPDSSKVRQEDVIGRQFLTIPYIGYLLRYIKTLPGLLILIIVPSTIIIYEESKKIHREAKRIIVDRKNKKQSKGEA